MRFTSATPNSTCSIRSGATSDRWHARYWRRRDAKRLVALAVLVTLTLAPAAAKAVVLTYQQPVPFVTGGYKHQDATVRNVQTTAPNNTTRVLLGNTGTPSNEILRAIFSFPLTGISPGAIVNSVKLTMGQDPDTGTSESADFIVELRSVSRTFFEGTGPTGTGGDSWSTTFGSVENPMALGATVLSSAVLNPETVGVTSHDFVSSPAFVAAVQAAVDAEQSFNFALVAEPAVENAINAQRRIFRLGSNLSDPNAPGGNPPAPLLEIDFTAPPEGLAGDYNGDETVDMLDYVVWRMHLDGDESSLAPGSRDPSNSGPVNADDYDFWTANYGNSGDGSGASAAVPEPGTVGLWMLAAVSPSLGLIRTRRQRSNRCLSSAACRRIAAG